MLGFAAGVMLAASFWSLLAPAIEMSKDLGKFSFVPALVGFLLGGYFYVLLTVLFHIYISGFQSKQRKDQKLLYGKVSYWFFPLLFIIFQKGQLLG